MNDKQIAAFLSICECGSMNRAAEKLYISQPALKKRIDTLEEELGASLLRRTNEGCILTKAGRVFFEEIKPIYEKTEAIIKRVRGMREQHVLRVCTLPDISLEGQDRLLIAFAHENPDVQVEWVPLPTSMWIDAVADGRADMCGSLYMEGEVEQFHREHIRIFPVSDAAQTVCVLSSKHPLAKKPQLTMCDLKACEVYAGPLLFHCGGLKEYAEREGLTITPDDNAGKRYKVIERCEDGAVYIHAGSYADGLRPLAVRPISGFTCRSCWIWNDRLLELAERFLAFTQSGG